MWVDTDFAECGKQTQRFKFNAKTQSTQRFQKVKKQLFIFLLNFYLYFFLIYFICFLCALCASAVRKKFDLGFSLPG